MYAVDELRIKTNNEMDLKEKIKSEEILQDAASNVCNHLEVYRRSIRIELLRELANSSNDIQNVSDLLIAFAKEFQANNKWQILTPEEMAEIYLDE